MRTLLLLPITALLAACALQQRTSLDAPIPHPGMAGRAKTSMETLDIGYGIYMRKCGECHLHKLPDELNDPGWHVIVPGMAWNAGIEPVEKKALLTYLQAARHDIVNGEETFTSRR